MAKYQLDVTLKKISWFKKNYEGLGKRENYSNDQIKEYKVYIDLAEMFIKI